MSIVLYDSATKRAWLIDAERAVLQILLHSHQALPGNFKAGLDLVCARSNEPESARLAMIENGKKIIRESLDAETGAERNTPFSKSVKDLWEKLKSLGVIAREQYQNSMHSSNFALGNKVLYGFEYLGLVQSTGS